MHSHNWKHIRMWTWPPGQLTNNEFIPYSLIKVVNIFHLFWPIWMMVIQSLVNVQLMSWLYVIVRSHTGLFQCGRHLFTWHWFSRLDVGRTPFAEFPSAFCKWNIAAKPWHDNAMITCGDLNSWATKEPSNRWNTYLLEFRFISYRMMKCRLNLIEHQHRLGSDHI